MSHWMWFVFPQLRSLGRSPTAKRYGLSGLAEAKAYLAHLVLGPRLLECFEAAIAADAPSATALFGTPDDLKFRSCATLFSVAGPTHDVFDRALARYFHGERDPLALSTLAD